MLQAFETPKRSRKGAPHCASCLAFNRNDLAPSVFRFCYDDGTSRFFKFVYAMQNPVFFAMMEIQVADGSAYTLGFGGGARAKHTGG